MVQNCQCAGSNDGSAIFKSRIGKAKKWECLQELSKEMEMAY